MIYNIFLNTQDLDFVNFAKYRMKQLQYETLEVVNREFIPFYWNIMSFYLKLQLFFREISYMKNIIILQKFRNRS